MELLFNWIGGATFILSIGNINIAVDPALCEKGTVLDFYWFKSKRIKQPIYSEKDFKNIDIWLITHKHKDHLDSIGLSNISNFSKIVCNKNSSSILKQSKKNNLTILDWNETKEFNIKGYKIEIEAIPAIHGINPISALLAGNVNGYYLTISKDKEKKSIYITGDTVYKNKIIRSLKDKKIDLLIPNMGAVKQGSCIMTMTLSSKMLKKMISKLNPKLIIPIHHSAFEHYIEPISKIHELKDSRIQIIETGSKTIF